MRRHYRISLKPPAPRRRDPVTRAEKTLVALQRKLNEKFIARRDAGQNIEPVYSHLKMVERRIAAAGLRHF